MSRFEDLMSDDESENKFGILDSDSDDECNNKFGILDSDSDDDIKPITKNDNVKPITSKNNNTKNNNIEPITFKNNNVLPITSKNNNVLPITSTNNNIEPTKNDKNTKQLKKEKIPKNSLKQLSTQTIYKKIFQLSAGSKIIFDEVDIVINSKTKYCVYGVNGCGKTTLINYIYNDIKEKEIEDILMINQDIVIENDEQTIIDFMLNANNDLYDKFKEFTKFENNDDLKGLTSDLKEGLSSNLKDEELLKYNELSNYLEQNEWYSYEAETNKILNGLGFENINLPVKILSGGWRMRLALGKALLRKPTLLILDEPTNNLSIKATVWLSNYLSEYNNTLIVITHDIGLMNTISDVIWHIYDKTFSNNNLNLSNTLLVVNGSYHKLVKTLEQQQAESENNYNNYDKQLTELRKKSTTKAKIDEFIKNNKVERPDLRTNFKIEFQNISNFTSKNIIEFRDVKFGYEQMICDNNDNNNSFNNTLLNNNNNSSDNTLLNNNDNNNSFNNTLLNNNDNNNNSFNNTLLNNNSFDNVNLSNNTHLNNNSFNNDNLSNNAFLKNEQKIIFKKLNISIDLGSRFVLVGENGNGKSTFFKLLMEEIKPIDGEIIKDGRIRIGYFNQQIAESLPLTLTPLEYLTQFNNNITDCCAYLGKIGIRNNTKNIKINDLSGGQKVKLLLCAIQIQKPHVILFDEVSNHLDFQAIKELIKAINEFNGAVIVITHDMYLIESIKNIKICIVENNDIKIFNDEFENYINKL